MNVLCLLTCYNRKEKTENCIVSLVRNNPLISFSFVITDDGSTDGTREVLRELSMNIDIEILEGGGLYYSGGMRKAMEYSLKKNKSFDYLLMANDDVAFFNNTIEKMIAQSEARDKAVIVGPTCDNIGKISYSGIKFTKGYKYRKINTGEQDAEADTFNANCVLIPYRVFTECGAIDSFYIHSLGDFDYGLEIRKHGYKIVVLDEYCGMCNNNTIVGTWNDPSLPRRMRLKLKESVKGAPRKQWFYFLKKHFGLFQAVKGSVTPYIRILLKK